MTAIEISQPGGPEVLKPAKRPVPKPGANELLVKVAAAGVNRPDVAQRLGFYPPPPGAPDIPGLEIAGEVVAAGPGIEGGWKIGDKLCALVIGGGYAEYCIAPAPQCLAIPKGYDMVKAAALPETFFTVWTNVFERGALKPDETLLVHGGASGIGTTTIQLAKAFGAKVLATAGSDERVKACLKLGADRAINYKTEDFAAVVKDFTGGKGVDVVLDMVGGSYLAKNLDSLAVEGRLVLIATLGGTKAEANLNTIMVKRLTVTGSTLRPRTVAQKATIAVALRGRVWPLLDQGKLAPVIDRTFPLAQAAEAHRALDGDHTGKIMLTVG
ncbi:NAD(P)H-quinone oxidoreductase [Desertibaculum subflavum]|uniref:NAD(P)H-quinone oxidoreductase n=1 Tax=Desertibaculum subflavum TaxID=2268458 RepID=UPI000E663BFE